MGDIFSARNKFIALFCAFVTINILIYLDYRSRMSYIFDMKGSEAETTATLVATIIKYQYMEDYKKVLITLDDKSAEYMRIKDLMAQYRLSCGYRFLFTFNVKDKDKGELVYIIDSEQSGSSFYAKPGSVDVIKFSPALKNQIENPYQSFHDSEPFKEPKWGVFISGFAPIIDSESGTHLGYVQADIDEKSVNMLRACVLLGYQKTLIVVNSIIIILAFLTFYSLYRNSRLQQGRVSEVEKFFTQFTADPSWRSSKPRKSIKSGV